MPSNWKVQVNGNAATIDIWGEMVDAKERLHDFTFNNLYTADEFKKDITACKDCSQVTVNINSLGGDLFFGVAAHNALRSLDAEITTRITGIAASAATIIFCAGTRREVCNGGVFMAHGASRMCNFWCSVNDRVAGDMIADLKNMRNSLVTCNRAISDIYEKSSNLSAAEWLKMISNGGEVWQTADDMLECGLATDKCEEAANLSIANQGGKTALYAGNRIISDNFRAPQNAVALGIMNRCNAPESEGGQGGGNTENNTNMGDENKKPAEPVESTPQNPQDDSAAATAEAVKNGIIAERQRIAAVQDCANKLGNMVAPELVRAALYGDANGNVMTASEFALAAVNAMPQGAQHNAQASQAAANFAAARAEETAANAAVQAAPANATATPASTQTERTESGLRADVAEALNRYDNNKKNK